MARSDERTSSARLVALLVASSALIAWPLVAQAPPVLMRDVTVLELRAANSARDTSDLILRYARQHRPDQYDTARGAGDEQRLMIGRCDSSCSYGPRVLIQPRRNTHAALTRARRDSGVIIARMINLDSASYPKFNLHGRDTVYWWIRTGRDSASVFVSTAPGAGAKRSDLTVDRHPRPLYRQALARWLWNDRDEEAWATCDGSRCCRSDGND